MRALLLALVTTTAVGQVIVGMRPDPGFKPPIVFGLPLGGKLPKLEPCPPKPTTVCWAERPLLAPGGFQAGLVRVPALPAWASGGTVEIALSHENDLARIWVRPLAKRDAIERVLSAEYERQQSRRGPPWWAHAEATISLTCDPACEIDYLSRWFHTEWSGQVIEDARWVRAHPPKGR